MSEFEIEDCCSTPTRPCPPVACPPPPTTSELCE